jgi:hypothetical protein
MKKLLVAAILLVTPAHADMRKSWQDQAVEAALVNQNVNTGIVGIKKIGKSVILITTMNIPRQHWKMLHIG